MKIQTINGRYFDFANMESFDFDIETIAHALSNLCRFTGHSGAFYSVCQHSVLVSRLVPDHLALHGLLHDATEAFMGDISSPLKAMLPDYKRLEDRLEAVILRKFGLDGAKYFEVKKADLIALRTEQRDIMHSHDQWEGLDGIEPDKGRIVPHLPFVAKQMFLERYEEITR